jgi:hypothetical protein
MPAKAISGRAGRTYAEPNFAQTAIQTLTSSDNRPIVTAVGMFAVSQLLRRR